MAVVFFKRDATREDDEDEDARQSGVDAVKTALRTPSAKRVQLRIPLEDAVEAEKALMAVRYSVDRALDALRSARRQRKPGLLCPLTTARRIVEQCNKVVNARRRPPDK